MNEFKCRYDCGLPQEQHTPRQTNKGRWYWLCPRTRVRHQLQELKALWDALPEEKRSVVRGIFSAATK